MVGLEPTKPKGSRFTVCSRCRLRTPQCRVEPRGVEPRYLDFQSSAYTMSAKVPSAEAKGFEPLRRFRLPVFKTGAIDQLCQTSIFCGSRRIRTFGAFRLGTLAMCWYRPLTHTSELISGAKVNMPNAVFLRNQKNLQKKFIFPKIYAL